MDVRWSMLAGTAAVGFALAVGPRTGIAAEAFGLLRKHCGECHFDGAAEGGVDLGTLTGRFGDAPSTRPKPGEPDHATWLALWRNLRAETMPPADAPRPTPDDRAAMIRLVEGTVLGVDPARPDPGRPVLRRLNREEYANTVHDLTGLDVKVIEDLPADDTGYGFDTIGDVLSMSPLLVEKYVAIAARVADEVARVAVASPRAGGDKKDGAREYPATVRRLFPEGPPPDDPKDRPGHLRRTLTMLARRAFRRPVENASLDALVGVATAASEASGGSFEKGVAAAVSAVLASPRFLFRVEDAAVGAPAGRPGASGAVPLDDHSLACRLSYLLWSSMPDDELFGIASKGKLHENLGRQVDRMIADPRADRFVRNFVGQWLQTRDIENLPVDGRHVIGARDRGEGEKIFGRSIRRAMREETEMLFAHVLRSRLPATDLVVGRQTFLNAELAKFYGISGVDGQAMRLTSLDESSHRGGLLTHGGLLFVTSNPTRTSPVKRGLFVIDNLLGTPAPPAPPDVPPLEASAKQAGREPSMRELMEIHRRDALCRSCHARMDPLGLALEGYNLVGQWRGEAATGLDTSGRLITGETFSGPRELAEVIAGARRRDFHRCLVEKLLTYALGRGVEYFDAPAVDTIVQLVEADGRLSGIVHGVVQSVPFRMTRVTVEAK